MWGEAWRNVSWVAKDFELVQFGEEGALLPGVQGQDTWEWFKAAPGEVQNLHQETFLS